MANPLWAPWRMEYILGPKNRQRCVFCGIAEASSDELRERLVLCRTERAFVMLNRYPFTAGHLLVVPHRHVDGLEALDRESHIGLFDLVREAAVRLRDGIKAEGLNIGINVGAVAGASLAEHLHVHIVPRWGGDTNFFPVLTGTRVVPQALDETLAALAPFFAGLSGTSDTAIP